MRFGAVRLVATHNTATAQWPEAGRDHRPATVMRIVITVNHDPVVGGPHFVRSGRIRVTRHVTTPLKTRCSAALLSLEHNGREGQN